ncbi:MAG: DUF5915 domain-containing protein [Candidatus Andersenbacteria bacterium]
MAGKKYGAEVKGIAAQLAAGTLKKKLADEDLLVTYRGKPGTAVAGERDVLVALDVALTPAPWRTRGWCAKWFVLVQDLRKEASYAVTDRIVPNCR